MLEGAAECRRYISLYVPCPAKLRHCLIRSFFASHGKSYLFPHQQWHTGLQVCAPPNLPEELLPPSEAPTWGRGCKQVGWFFLLTVITFLLPTSLLDHKVEALFTPTPAFPLSFTDVTHRITSYALKIRRKGIQSRPRLFVGF